MKKFWLLSVVVGLVVLAVSWVYFNNTRKAEVESRLLDTVSYVKVQCSTYSNYNEATESQAILRLIESARQLSRNLQVETAAGKSVDEELLADHTKGFWLSGIVLLDENGQVVQEYHRRPDLAKVLSGVLENGALRDTAKYDAKIYGHRLEIPGGGYIDLAACGRADTKGVVVVYYYTPSQYALTYNLPVQNILTGYSVDKDGTIMVVSDGIVIASNDRGLIGQDSADLAGVQELKENRDSRHMMYIESRKAYGVMLKQRDYYIYMFLPSAKLWLPMAQNMAMALFLYCLVVGIVWMTMQNSYASHRKREQEKERIYHAEIMESAEKAQAANRAKTEFLQRMSHDIRTPINGIVGMIEVADHYRDDLKKQDECRRKIRDASHLLLELINEVLDMGKLEAGNIVLDEKPFEIRETLLELTTVIEKLASEQGITCTKALENISHWHYVGSVAHLKRLLMNVMSNAVKYNREGGEIHLICREEPKDEKHSTLVFICKDTGIGMSEEYQKKIFEPFTREDETTKTAYGGTGLGMPIAKSLIERMGGTISFESKKGVGTTFTISIPFAIYEGETGKSTEEEIAGAALAGLRVLLVEDNELNMEISEFLVANEGAIVTKAWNGEEAVETFRESAEGAFDVILMDMMMPVMDGCEATRQIRAMDRADAKTIPIIAMTANAFSEDKEKTRAAGMNDHVSKPIKPKDLMQSILHWVKRNKD